MSDSKDVKLSSSMDATGVRKGVSEVKDAVRDMAQVVGQEAGKAGKSVDGIGAGGDASAKKIDQATKSIISSIERTTAAMQAGERGSASYYETLAKQRGVSGDALKPYLDTLRQAEAAQKASAGSLDKMGVSAKQTAAALRGVPAQFTDIFTSLQGGQAPLTVFLQQGGQLKDMFGGAGGAARALGGYVLGLVNPFTLAALAAGGLAVAYNVGANEAQAFQRTVILTGQVAGVTAGQLVDMAAAVKAAGAGTQGRAAEILNQMAGSADVGAGNLVRFTAAALRLQSVGGPAAEETAKAFASLAKDPLTAALKLNEGTNFLTRSIYEQIKSLTEQGRTVDAARVAQEAYADVIEQRTPQMLQNLGYIERAWLGIKDAIKFAGDALVSVGRTNTAQEQVTALQNRMAAIKAGNEGSEGKSLLPALQAQVTALQQGAKYEAQSAYFAGERVKALATLAKADKDGLQYLDKEAKKRQEIASTTVEFQGLIAAGLKTEKDLNDRISAIRGKYADKSKSQPGDAFAADRDAAREWAGFYERFSDAAADAEGKTAQLTKTQGELVKFLSSPAYQQMAEPARQLALQQAYAAVSAEQLNISTKESGKIASEAGKAYAQWLGELTKGADAAQQQAAALALEERAAGMTVLGYRSLAQAIQEVEIARLKEKQTAMLGDPAAVAEIEREIQARRELIRLVGAKEARKSADDAAKEWQRGADRIEDTITDALMRGFESGKDFAQTLRDTVVNMFKTLVLRPVVSAVVNPVAQAITGSLGFGNAASAAGSAAGGASSLGTLGSLAGIAGSLGTFGSAAGFGASALFGGTGLTALSGGASMIGAGSVAGGLGLMAGVLGPIALGLLAVTALMKDKNATLGYAGGSFSGGGAYSAAGGRLLEFGKGTSQASSELQKVTDSFSATLATTARSFGGSVADLQVFIGSDVDRKGRAAGSIQFLRDGQRLGGVQTGGTDPRSSAAAKIAAGELGDFFRDSASAALIAGLQQSNIEQRFADYFKGVAAYSLTEEQANAMLASAASAKALGESFGYLGGAFAKLQQISVPAAEALLQAFGGLEGFTSAAGAYYQAFYSDAERSAIATKQLTDSLGKLGQAMPATRDEFRRLVDAQDITTDSGQRMYSALLQLAPAFAAITDASGNIIASTAATEQAAALETRLLQLQGNTAELRRRELAALEPANRALQQRIYALQDAQTAAADAAQLGEAWASVGDTIADEVARIRGLSNEQVRNLAQVQADFAVTTAQARAGDQSAADRLPAISRELLDLASAGARSAQDLAVTRSTVAGSLAQTAEIARAMGSAYTAASKPQSAPGVLGDALGVLGEGIEKAIGKIADKFRAFFTAGDQPGFGEVGSFASGGYHRGGLRIVGENGPELEATGPARIFSADQTARLLSGGADQRALLAALQSLQAEVEGLRFEARATAGHTARLSRLHQDWDGRGLTVKTDADTPLATVTA